ncbi:hypothetical protein OSTOST_02287 [Ostertagia ostertagi]
MSDSFRCYRENSANGYLTDDDDDRDLSPNARLDLPEKLPESNDEEVDGLRSSSNDSVQDVVCSSPITPIELPASGPSLSDSLASLTVDEMSQIGAAADRSRSFIGGQDPDEPLSPYSARLANDPSSKGKLRDRLLRKTLSKSRKDEVPRHVLPFSTVGEEVVDVRKLALENPDEDIVEESIVTMDAYPEPDDIVVLYESKDKGRKSDVDKIDRSRGDAEPDVITIDSSSDEENGDFCSTNREAPPCNKRSRSPEEVKVVKTVSKFSHDTTGVLENKLANLNALTTRPLALPDGGEKLLQHINDVREELKIRKQIYNDTVTDVPDFLKDNAHDGWEAESRLSRYLRVYYTGLNKLFRAITSQPDAQQLTETPEGLLVPLKEHQMSGLTWMKWRESLSPKEEFSLIPSNATLVIAPAALIYHWETEIRSRCEDHLLKIKVYHNNRKNVQHEM